MTTTIVWKTHGQKHSSKGTEKSKVVLKSSVQQTPVLFSEDFVFTDKKTSKVYSIFKLHTPTECGASVYQTSLYLLRSHNSIWL